MKKKAIVLLAALASVISAVSCQKGAMKEDETTPTGEGMTIIAVSEEIGVDSKAELADKYNVLWNDYDEICVKNTETSASFTLIDGSGTTKGTFLSKTSISGEVEGFYPASVANLVWPAEQQYNQAPPMYCKKTLTSTENQTFNFTSLGAVLQLNFNSTTADIVLKSIEVKADEAMSGAFAIDSECKAVISQPEGDKPGITLDLGEEGVKLGTSARKFNIAVPAGEYHGLSIVFTSTDGKKCTIKDKTIEMVFNTVNTLAVSGEFKSDVVDADFASDYEFVELISNSYQICSAFGFEYDGAPVYVGVPKDPSKADELTEKYGTVYYIPDYASNGYGIYFNLDKNGEPALPDNYKMQNLGIHLMTGVDAYMVISDAKVSDRGVTIDYDIAVQNGNIMGRNYTDRFLIFVEAGIDDFVGEYTCPSLNNATVTVAKISDTELSFAGIDENGPFKFQMDGGYPSFVGGLINESARIYAYSGNTSSGSFYSKYYNLFNYKMSADGMLIPMLTSMATSNGISEILILAQTNQGWSLGKSYIFENLKLLPVENAAPLSVIPDMSRKLADYKGVTKTGLRFNGEPVTQKPIQAESLPHRAK